MPCIAVEEFLFWKKKQLSKGGDQQSFEVLLDCIGDISTRDLNLKILNPKGNLHLKKNLEFLESVWEDHLTRSCPIQYLCGITYWRDLKLKITNKVLIPRPETELIVDIVFNIFKGKSDKFFFNCKFPLGFKIFKFKSLAEISPIQSSKTSKDC